MLKKLFRAKPSYNWNIIEKETVDEVIFRTSNPRNRLMLELMAREMVAKAGGLVGIHLRHHDLRRHAATDASRSGVPIEIVSKVILRHSNLSTTERYLGKISDVEAMKWIDTLYA